MYDIGLFRESLVKGCTTGLLANCYITLVRRPSMFESSPDPFLRIDRSAHINNFT